MLQCVEKERQMTQTDDQKTKENVDGFLLELLGRMGPRPFTHERLLGRFSTDSLVNSLTTPDEIADFVSVTGTPSALVLELLEMGQDPKHFLRAAIKRKIVRPEDMFRAYKYPRLLERFGARDVWGFYADPELLLKPKQGDAMKEARNGIQLILRSALDHRLITQREVLEGPLGTYLADKASSKLKESIGTYALSYFSGAADFTAADALTCFVLADEVPVQLTYDNIVLRLIGHKYGLDKPADIAPPAPPAAPLASSKGPVPEVGASSLEAAVRGAAAAPATTEESSSLGAGPEVDVPPSVAAPPAETGGGTMALPPPATDQVDQAEDPHARITSVNPLAGAAPEEIEAVANSVAPVPPQGPSTLMGMGPAPTEPTEPTEPTAPAPKA